MATFQGHAGWLTFSLSAADIPAVEPEFTESWRSRFSGLNASTTVAIRIPRIATPTTSVMTARIRSRLGSFIGGLLINAGIAESMLPRWAAAICQLPDTTPAWLLPAVVLRVAKLDQQRPGDTLEGLLVRLIEVALPA